MATTHRLLAITQEAEDPATRYRVGLHVPYLLKRGVQLAITPWPRGKRERAVFLDSVADFDSVLVQRRLLTRAEMSSLRKRAKRLAYDFDDALVYRDSHRGFPFLLPDRLIRFRRMISECDTVTAGNSYLADLASRFCKGCPVTVVPTVLDAERYRNKGNPSRTSSQGFSVGWIGQRTTLPYLVALKSPLQELSRRVPDLRLVTISDKHPTMEHIAIESLPWEAESEVKMLSTIDVGLAPLGDNRWTRGKCGLRLLQYLAAGIPAVASPVGTQREIVERGACLSARGNHEWISAIEELINNEALRQELVSTGNALIQERFVAPLWTDHLLSVWCGIGLQRQHQ